MDPTKLPILRFVLFAGVFLFGAVSLVLVRSGTVPTPEPHVESLTRTLAYGSIPAVIIALFVVRVARTRAALSGRPALTLAGWAIAEMSGLLGAVLIYFGGEIWAWVAGLAIMVVSWQLIPADPGVE